MPKPKKEKRTLSPTNQSTPRKKRRTSNKTKKNQLVNIPENNLDDPKDFNAFIKALKNQNAKKKKAIFKKASEIWNTVYYPPISVDTKISPEDWLKIFKGEDIKKDIRDYTIVQIKHWQNILQLNKKKTTLAQEQWEVLYNDAKEKTIQSIFLRWKQCDQKKKCTGRKKNETSKPCEKEKIIPHILPRQFNPTLSITQAIEIFNAAIQAKRYKIQEQLWNHYLEFRTAYIKTFNVLQTEQKRQAFYEKLMRRPSPKIFSYLWGKIDSLKKSYDDRVEDQLLKIFDAAVKVRHPTICSDLFYRHQKLLITIYDNDKNNNRLQSGIKALVYTRQWNMVFCFIQHYLEKLSSEYLAKLMNNPYRENPKKRNQAENRERLIHYYNILQDLTLCNNTGGNTAKTCACTAHENLKKEAVSASPQLLSDSDYEEDNDETEIESNEDKTEDNKIDDETDNSNITLDSIDLDRDSDTDSDINFNNIDTDADVNSNSIDCNKFDCRQSQKQEPLKSFEQYLTEPNLLEKDEPSMAATTHLSVDSASPQPLSDSDHKENNDETKIESNETEDKREGNEIDSNDFNINIDINSSKIEYGETKHRQDEKNALLKFFDNYSIENEIFNLVNSYLNTPKKLEKNKINQSLSSEKLPQPENTGNTHEIYQNKFTLFNSNRAQTNQRVLQTAQLTSSSSNKNDSSNTRGGPMQ